MDKEIFRLISREEEKLNLWKDFGNTKGILIGKGDNSSFKAQVNFFDQKSNRLECKSDSILNLNSTETFYCHFFIGGEKYFFQTAIHNEGTTIFINVPEKLYHLQRRQNFRVRLPKGYKAFYDISKVNGHQQNLKFELNDLSGNGCLISHPLSPLLESHEVGHEITGTLVIQEVSLEIKGIIRHIKIEKNNKIRMYGVEFINLSPLVENKLYALTLDIYKQVFRRSA